MATEETPLIKPPTQKDPRINDEPQHMTLSRRLALYLSKYSWYNPNPDRLSIDKAWHYFEHVTLARHYFVPSKEEQDATQAIITDYHQKAEPGDDDRPTRLYSFFCTPESDLADWGIGVGIYFFTLRALAIIMLLTGIINTPALLYYASDEYSGARENMYFRALKTSAICTDSTWVPCPTCSKEQWMNFPSTLDRYAESENGLKFILRNNCYVESKVAIVSYVSLLFVCISVYVLQKITKRRERFFDAASQTTTDYAVEVVNPPKDARDMNEWRTFFQQFGHVTCCTVALDNEELEAALVKRRELLLNLESLLPPNVLLEYGHGDLQDALDKAGPVPWYYKLMGYKDADRIGAEIKTLNELIETDLSQRHYDVSNVFVIFETEHAQQQALKQLACLGIDKHRNNIDALPTEMLFRGNKVLAVKEPPEPSSVRWKDLDETAATQLLQRFCTFLFTLCIILASGVIVTYMRYKHGIFYAALTVSAVNTLAPMACEYATDYESHPSEGEKQASLYYKNTAILWVNTAIITAFITPFADTLEDEQDALIPAMMAIFITELFKAPVAQLLDIPGHIHRHILGPRAVDQRRMNTHFQGTPWLLSERYTVRESDTTMFISAFFLFQDILMSVSHVL
jgi:hypothetical protein